jgi:dCTP deaminase
MGLLADHQIKYRASLPTNNPRHLRIDPFSEPVSTPGILSYGNGSYGYDLRLGEKFLYFDDLCIVIDPLTIAVDIALAKDAGKSCEFVCNEFVIPAGGFVLAQSLEHITMPEDCLGLVSGKSTLARCGLSLNTTMIEPGWRGIITLELSNLTRSPLRVHANQGIGQLVFMVGDSPCRVPYNRKKNPRYQDQEGLSAAKVA